MIPFHAVRLSALERERAAYPRSRLVRMPTDDDRAAYREALDDWQQKLVDVHRFLLDGDRQGKRPDEIKGMLNREARAKEKYDEARRRLLGLE